MRIICGTILVAAICAAGMTRADRIDDMMSKMTLREKIGQCVQIELDKFLFPVGFFPGFRVQFCLFPGVDRPFRDRILAEAHSAVITNAVFRRVRAAAMSAFLHRRPPSF